MAKEHPPVTEATAKSLYGHAFGCAFEGCRRPLYRLDSETGIRTLNSRICHINARREGGPRWEPGQTPEENRSQANLILMCLEHAAAIDVPETIRAYPAEMLREWKQKQLEQYNRICQGWVLDDAMARETIEASAIPSDVVINNSTVSLGGSGGKAPGAGGGGGGAIGRNARGGRGGDGGGQRIDNGSFTLPLPNDTALSSEIGGLDFVPGAGGAGAGVRGDNAIGGDGGHGGERVSARIDITEMRKHGLHRLEYTVGKGGVSGARGEDTIINFVTEDGRILKTIRAVGGKTGGSTLPEEAVEVSLGDIRHNFRVTTFMLANSIDFRDGLFFLLGGDWSNFPTSALPASVRWPVVYSVRWTPNPWQSVRGFFVSLLRPGGQEAIRRAITIPIENGTGGVFHGFFIMNAMLDVVGTWILRIHSGEFLLAQLEVSVVMAS